MLRRLMRLLLLMIAEFRQLLLLLPISSIGLGLFRHGWISQIGETTTASVMPILLAAAVGCGGAAVLIRIYGRNRCGKVVAETGQGFLTILR